MRSLKITVTMGATFLLLLCSGTIVQAQTGIDPQRLAAIRQKLTQIEGVLNGLPPSSKKTLSSGAQNLLKLAQGWDETEGGLGGVGLTSLGTKSQTLSGAAKGPDAGSFTISNPATDFLFSLMAGFTQSETSTSWCGNNVVTGFNDSGSVFESMLFGPGGLSFTGVSISSDKGASFRDAGFINPGNDFNNFLGGDPVVTCTSAPADGSIPTFFYSQIFNLGPPTAPVAAVAVSKSRDGGASWSLPSPLLRRTVSRISSTSPGARSIQAIPTKFSLATPISITPRFRTARVRINEWVSGSKERH